MEKHIERERIVTEIEAIERKLRGIDPMAPEDTEQGLVLGYTDWHLEQKELDGERSVTHDYIRDNFRSDDNVALVLLNKQTGHIQQRIATVSKIASHPYQRWLRHMNASRYEVYISMNTMKPEARGRTKSDVEEIRHIYLDFDADGKARAFNQSVVEPLIRLARKSIDYPAAALGLLPFVSAADLLARTAHVGKVETAV